MCQGPRSHLIVMWEPVSENPVFWGVGITKRQAFIYSGPTKIDRRSSRVAPSAFLLCRALVSMLTAKKNTQTFFTRQSSDGTHTLKRRKARCCPGRFSTRNAAGLHARTRGGGNPVANDSYVILRRGPNGHYSRISTSIGKEKADSCAALLKLDKPGEYLLLNLRTKIIEEWNETSSKPSSGGPRARA